MKKWFFLLLGLTFLCQTAMSQESAAVPLFGKNLENADFAAESWKINDQGELYSVKSDCTLWTKEKYGSFICSFEFKTSKGSNSGFLIHSHDRDDWIPNTMEIQLADDAGGKPSYNSTASFYGYQAASKNLTKPAGQWNKMVVTCLGTKLTVELNGEKVNEMDYAQWTNNAKGPAGTKIEAKFHGRTLAKVEPYGYIGFQGLHNRDAQTTFRNLTIQKINFANENPTELLFGQKLEKAEFDPNIWSIDQDGCLRANKDNAIWSKVKYRNYVLDLEFKTTKGANSGVVILCSTKADWIPNSLEIQIFDSFGRNVDYSDCGAVFGRCAPLFNMMKEPGQWNKMRIVCKDNMIYVVLNGELTTVMDRSRWTDKVVNPDGTKAFPWLTKIAPADLDKDGFIGVQGLHGTLPIIYRNIKIKTL